MNSYFSSDQYFIPEPSGEAQNRQPFRDPSQRVIEVLEKTVRMNVEFTFFELLTLFS